MAIDIEYRTGLVVIRTDVASLLEFGREPTASAKNIRVLTRFDRFGRDFWGMSSDSARNLNEWPEGLELVDRYRQMLPELPPLPAIKRAAVWTADGDEFDRDRFDAGIDECWRTRRRVTRTAMPTLRLTAAIGGNCDKTPRELAWTGAVAAAVCDAAEDAGYRLDIEAVHSSSGYTSADKVEIVGVKRASDPFCLHTAVMALSCPAFFRWHVAGSGLLADRRAKDNLGATMDTPAEFVGDLHIGRCYSEREATAECQRLIGQIGRMAVGEEIAA